MSGLSSTRQTLRQEKLTLRNQVSAAKRAGLEALLIKQLIALPVIADKKSFFVYCSYQSEVGTQGLIEWLLQKGKSVAVPLTDQVSFTMEAVAITDPVEELICGYKGIPEPKASLLPGNRVAPVSLDVALIPGSVFDLKGNRLGYGGGYYDRFLALKAPKALRIGLAYSFQVIDRIPHQPHDIPMDWLVTEEGILHWPRDTAR